mmetsp:Transcript_86346/g.152874  ORF Transcript_86346/g.152874 Transcript_86346/m.152874 type:complete len:433 (+) Transcript_86346:60-1358(+)
MVLRMSPFGVLVVLAYLGHAVADTIPIAGGKYAMQWVRNISVHRPGYTQLPPEVPGKMIITSFEGTPFFAKHAVYALDIAKEATSAPELLPGSDTIDWPNAATGIPRDVFGFEAVALGNGFLVPSHTTGGVWIMEATATPTKLPAPVKITKDKHDSLPDSGWFYHMTYFMDLNNDGRLDILTSRCQYGVWPWAKKRGELLWLEQPSENALSGEPWAEHHLADGPDFLFCMHPNEKWLAAPEYVGERVVFYSRLPNGTLQSRVLDDHSGPGFGCSWKDLNGDGRLELLVTNHLNQNGSVFAYEFDREDFPKAGVSRHVLATGFHAMSDAQGTASPGDAVAFHPMTSADEKPHILVSGDNSNSLFMLVPTSASNRSWSYVKQELTFLGADIGRPSLTDVDKDGFTDLYVPAYDNDVIVHYKFMAAKELPSTVLV